MIDLSVDVVMNYSAEVRDIWQQFLSTNDCLATAIPRKTPVNPSTF